MLWGGGKTRVGADSRHGRETMEPPHLQQHSLYSLHLYEPSNATMSHISNLFILNLSVCPPHRTIPTVRMQAPWKASQNGSLKLSHKSDMWFRCSGKYLNIYEKRREKMLSLPPPLSSPLSVQWNEAVYCFWHGGGWQEYTFWKSLPLAATAIITWWETVEPL